MKALLTGKRLVILIIALLIAGVTIVSINTSGDDGFFSSAANTLVKPLKSAVSAITRTYESIYGYIYEYDKVVAENEALRAEIAEKDSNYRDQTEIIEENERLHKLLDFTSRNDDMTLEPAIIMSYGASNWSSSFTVSKGSSNSDIAVGDCIITESGILIGQISEVGATTSTAVTVVDTTFSSGATVGDSTGSAVFKGDFTLMRSGLACLQYLPDAVSVATGDTVYTSGAGGVFPNGLIIGSVADAGKNSALVGYYATVTPAVKVENVTHVYIVTDFEIGG